MAKPNSPLDDANLQSFLYKSGIRFDFNIVDTVCNRRFGLSLYLALVAILLILTNLGAQHISFELILIYLTVLAFLGVYVCFYLLRLFYFTNLKYKLRKDEAPIVVEAYTVICLDVKHKWSDYFVSFMLGSFSRHFYKYAVVYKEVGTNKPRFFLSAAVSANRICFVPEQIGRVFIHRKKSAYYTLDDKSAYQTVSKKQVIFQKLVTSPNNLTKQEDK